MCFARGSHISSLLTILNRKVDSAQCSSPSSFLKLHVLIFFNYKS